MALSKLAQKLVDKNMLEASVAEDAHNEAISRKVSFISYIVANDIIEANDLLVFCAEAYGMPAFDMESLNLDLVPKEIIPTDALVRYHVYPIFKRENILFVGLSDPTNTIALDEVKFHANCNVQAILVSEKNLAYFIDEAKSISDMSSMDELGEDLDSLELSSEDDDIGDLSGSKQDETPVVRFVNKVLLDAIAKSVSDIHFEPYERMYRVRYRKDGILMEVQKPPSNIASRISSRLKVVANLDISERRIPQDGRFKMKVSKGKFIDFRVSTCPTLFGEKVVLRILDPASAQVGVDALGFEEFQKKMYLDALSKPQGLILVTGPTGSGKTVSLYTGLNILNEPERNISTVEDPVEINMEGINQVNVNNKANLTFASALRSFLRQDPDVVMVGEVRDLETGEIAVKAAQTGHLVLSTLHTNSAADTLTRMLNMGIPTYNLATSVILIIAQRLARKLCENCKEKKEVPESALLELGFEKDNLPDVLYVAGTGCSQCTEGYKGRIGIYEVLKISEAISKIIMRGGNAIDVLQQAVNDGLWTLRRSGLDKVRQGVTTVEEINRITID